MTDLERKKRLSEIDLRGFTVLIASRNPSHVYSIPASISIRDDYNTNINPGNGTWDAPKIENPNQRETLDIGETRPIPLQHKGAVVLGVFPVTQLGFQLAAEALNSFHAR